MICFIVRVHVATAGVCAAILNKSSTASYILILQRSILQTTPLTNEPVVMYFSGFLVALSFLKQLKRSAGKLSLKQWVMHYVHRYWRYAVNRPLLAARCAQKL